jgi:hypothetical protein
MSRLILAASLVFVAALQSPSAMAVSPKVMEACRGDYQAYCSQHEVGSEALRDCMAESFDKLTAPCVAAILDSGAANEPAQPRKSAKRAGRHGHHGGLGVASYIRHGKHVARRFVARLASRVRFARR